MDHQDTNQMHVVQDLTLEILDLRNKNAEMLEALKEVVVRIAKREPQDLASLAVLVAKAEAK